MGRASNIINPQVCTHDWRRVAALIDHTLLKPDTTQQEVVRLCREAVQYGFATVFVHPWHVALAVACLSGSAVKVGTPIGFPQGAHLTTVKRFEAEQALITGARELDMVLNIGALKSGLRERAESDICGVVEIAHGAGVILKLILETSLLARAEKILACQIAVSAGADFVKTATGLLGGATVEDVALMRSAVGDRLGVKAAGGIRSAAQLLSMLEAGANRIGTSSGVNILRELGAPELAAE